jgi:hypothetical protein
MGMFPHRSCQVVSYVSTFRNQRSTLRLEDIQGYSSSFRRHKDTLRRFEDKRTTFHRFEDKRGTFRLSVCDV